MLAIKRYYRSSITLLILLFICGCASTQNKRKSQNKFNQLINSGMVDKGEFAVLSVKYWNNLLIIPVKIDDKVYSFLFDSGAMISLISDSIANNSKVLGSYPITDDLGNEKEIDIVHKDISIGDVKLSKIGCGKFDFSIIEEQTCLKIDGILGANAINLLNWKINPIKNEVKCSKEIFVIEDSSSIILEYQLYASLLPLVKMNLNNESFWTLIDWGFSDYLYLNDSLYYKTKKADIFPQTSGIGKRFQTINRLIESDNYLSKIDSLFIDGVLFQNLFANINIGKPALGSKFLNNYTAIINTKDRKLILTPQSNTQNSEPFQDYGVHFCINEQNELVVCYIWNESRFAKRENIKLGDRVLFIDNFDTQRINYEEWCSIKEIVTQKQKISLTLKQGSNTNKTTLFKEIILK